MSDENKPLDLDKPMQGPGGGDVKYLDTMPSGNIRCAIMVGVNWGISSFDTYGNGLGDKKFICIRNTPEKQRVTGFLVIHSSRAMTALLPEDIRRYRENNCPSAVAVIDLSKYNIEYEEGDGIE